MKRLLFRLPMLLSMLMLVFTACQKQVEEPALDELDARSNGTRLKTIGQIAAQTDGFRILHLALAKADLQGAVNNKDANLTVFAPTDAAFAAIGLGSASQLDAWVSANGVEALRNILLYHVVGARVSASQVPACAGVAALNGDLLFLQSSGGVTINKDVSVVAADVAASNGIIHVVDKVILPPANIVNIAVGLPQFSQLVYAVGKAGLVDALSAQGALTVFAPTNDAFSAIGLATPADIDNFITANGIDVLTNILKYHVIAGAVYSCNLSEGLSPKMLNEDFTTISLMGGPSITGNGNGGAESNIVAADVIASNGVIHVIDRVLLP